MVTRDIGKAFIQQAIRGAHALGFDRGLPDRIAIYLHSVEPHQYEAFRLMISCFRSRDYRFVTPDEFVASPPGKVVFLSLDDCYGSWFEALPLFEEVGEPLTFYVNTSCLRDRSSPDEVSDYFDRLRYTGKRLPLSSDEVSALAAAGHTIGAHGHEHRSLTDVPLARAKDDIATNRMILEEIVGSAVVHFSYPYGMRRNFSQVLRSYCIDLGFKTIANAIPGLQHVRQRADDLCRSGWNLERPLSHNTRNLRIDGHLFERFTGRSAVG